MPKSRKRNKRPKRPKKPFEAFKKTGPPTQANPPHRPPAWQGQFPGSNFGGQRQEIVTVLVDANGNNPDGAGPQGAVGAYSVTFLLQKPGYSLFGEREFRFGANVGDSHLMLGDGARVNIAIVVDGVNADIIGTPNRRGALAALTMRIQADSFKAAKDAAYRFATPTLSLWSAMIDVPIEISRIELVEEATGSQQMSVTNPFNDSLVQTAVGNAGAASADLRVFLSYYREALNSNSEPYQLLCFFKVIDGIRSLRIRLSRAAARNGQPAPPNPPVEAVPATHTDVIPWLRRLFPHRPNQWDEMDVDSVFIQEARGVTVEELVSGGGGGTPPGALCALRNEIAHTIGPAGAGTNLIADEALHTARVSHWLPLAKCIARLLLMHQFPQELWQPPPVADAAAQGAPAANTI